MKSIILTIGLQGSGKSTWAKEELRKNPGRYKRVNKDSLRLMLDNEEFTFANEKFVLFVRDKIVEKALRDGFSVIVDDTNFPAGGKHFLRMCEIAQLVGDVQVVEKFFEVSLKDALERNKNRTDAVPEDVIHNAYEKHIKNKRFECQVAYFPPREEGVLTLTESKKKAIIFDVDGTLAIRGDRGAFDWSKVGVDKVNEPIVWLANIIALDEEIHVIVVSGRDGVCAWETRKWLTENGIYFDALFMRPENDNRKDVIVKQEIYDNHIKDYYNVLFVVDDRSQVVEMWRRNGICCLQCANGDF